MAFDHILRTIGQTPISLALRTKRPDSVLVPLVSAVSVLCKLLECECVKRGKRKREQTS